MKGTEGASYLSYCPGFHIDRRVRYVDKLLKKNKKVMKESHYELETKISPVCAFKIQQGQDTDSQDLPTGH